ncbi:MAG: hypothetical protein WBA44_13260 [Mesorhizobium sp.]
MVKEGLIAMALVGCDCDAKMCEFIETGASEWSSVSDCEAGLRSRIVQQHENFPLVIAVCRPKDEAPLMASAKSDEVRQLADAAMSASASRTVDPAGRISTIFKTIDGYVSVSETAGTIASAAQRARAMVTRFTASVTPDWF